MSLGLLPIAGGEYTDYTRKRRTHSQDPCSEAARTLCSANVLGYIKGTNINTKLCTLM